MLTKNNHQNMDQGAQQKSSSEHRSGCSPKIITQNRALILPKTEGSRCSPNIISWKRALGPPQKSSPRTQLYVLTKNHHQKRALGSHQISSPVTTLGPSLKSLPGTALGPHQKSSPRTELCVLPKIIPHNPANKALSPSPSKTTAQALQIPPVSGRGTGSASPSPPGTPPAHQVLLCAIDRHELLIILQLSGGPEIGQFVDALPVLPHQAHDVAGFDVPVHDPVLPEVIHPCHWEGRIPVWGWGLSLDLGRRK